MNDAGSQRKATSTYLRLAGLSRLERLPVSGAAAKPLTCSPLLGWQMMAANGEAQFVLPVGPETHPKQRTAAPLAPPNALRAGGRKGAFAPRGGAGRHGFGCADCSGCADGALAPLA